MKSLFAALLAVGLMTACVGCGGGEEEGSGDEETSSATTSGSDVELTQVKLSVPNMV